MQSYENTMVIIVEKKKAGTEWSSMSGLKIKLNEIISNDNVTNVILKTYLAPIQNFLLLYCM